MKINSNMGMLVIEIKSVGPGFREFPTRSRRKLQEKISDFVEITVNLLARIMKETE